MTIYNTTQMEGSARALLRTDTQVTPETKQQAGNLVGQIKQFSASVLDVLSPTNVRHSAYREGATSQVATAQRLNGYVTPLVNKFGLGWSTLAKAGMTLGAVATVAAAIYAAPAGVTGGVANFFANSTIANSTMTFLSFAARNSTLV